jgi:hypothetical protein
VTKKQEIAWIGDRLGDVLMIRSVGIDEEWADNGFFFDEQETNIKKGRKMLLKQH